MIRGFPFILFLIAKDQMIEMMYLWMTKEKGAFEFSTQMLKLRICLKNSIHIEIKERFERPDFTGKVKKRI